MLKSYRTDRAYLYRYYRNSTVALVAVMGISGNVLIIMGALIVANAAYQISLIF